MIYFLKAHATAKPGKFRSHYGTGLYAQALGEHHAIALQQDLEYRGGLSCSLVPAYGTERPRIHLMMQNGTYLHAATGLRVADLGPVK